MIEEIREQIKDERQSLFDTLLDTLSEEEYRECHKLLGQYADLKGLDYIDSVESNSSEVGKILQDSLSADVSDSYSDSYSDSENSGIYSYNYLREEEEEETEEPLSEGSYNSSLNQTEVEKKRNRAIKPFQADKERANSLFSKLNKVRRLFK
jgi:hypothetical protein